ncbi:MAG: hypothetical protein LUG93_03355, partial [Lachnospiraceae bacterium]|nr:hypothetical protein [Lachnospiraceae bacterium]
MAMIFQQTGISTLADDGTTLAAETAVTESTTEAAETNSDNTSNTEAAEPAASASTDETAVGTTAADTNVSVASGTEAEGASDTEAAADAGTDSSAASGDNASQDTSESSDIVEAPSDTTQNENNKTADTDTEEVAEAAGDAAAEETTGAAADAAVEESTGAAADAAAEESTEAVSESGGAADASDFEDQTEVATEAAGEADASADSEDAEATGDGVAADGTDDGVGSESAQDADIGDTDAAAGAEAETEAESETEAETETEAPKTSFTYSDSRVVITAIASEEANLPQDAELKADYIEPGSDVYNEAVSQIESQLGSTLGLNDENTETVYILYDVYFLSDGERVEPEDGTVSVSMVFRSAVDLGIEGEIVNTEVVHIKDSGEAEIVTDYVNVNENGDVTAMGFTQDSFSVTGVVASGVMTVGEATVDADGNVALEDISSSITATLESSSSDVSRTGTLKIAISYVIDDDELDTAKSATAWTYDLTSLLTSSSSASAIFESVYKDGAGYIFSGSTVVGKYTIVNGVVYLYIDSDWLAQQTSGVNGTFDFYCSFDSSAIGTDEEVEIVFPGTSSTDPIEIEFEDVDVETSKKVNGTTGNAGNYLMNSDGTITYTISATPNADLDTLTLTDTLGAGQTIDTSSIKINGTVVSSDYYTYDNGVLTVDVATFLKSQGSSVEADTTYTVTYTVTVDDSGWGTTLTNSAYWTWDGNASNSSNPDETTIKPYKNVTTKTVEERVENGTTYYDYTITIGDGTTNLAGYTISDVFSTANQVLVGNITINPAIGETTTITADSDGFTYTFPTSGTYTGPYTITYTTKLVTDGLTGWTSVTNTATTTNPDDPTVQETDGTYKSVDTGNEEVSTSASVTKEVGTLDTANNTISWTITINIPDGTTYDYLWVRDYNLSCTELDTGTVLSTLSIDWSNPSSSISISYTDGTPLTYAGMISNSDVQNESTGWAITPEVLNATAGTYYIYNNGDGNYYIMIPQASQSLVITLTTEISDTNWLSTKEGAKFYNAVTSSAGWNWGTYVGADTAEYVYVSNYQLSKTSSYDATTGITTWYVNINKSQKTYDPDITVSIYDIIPDGMSYVSGSFKYTVNGGESTNASVTTGTTTSGKETISVTLGGLSGNYYYCVYQTKLTGDDVISSNDDSTYTNHVYLKNGETELTDTTSTVTIKPTYITKDSATANEAISDTATDDLVTYTIVVNPAALNLSDSDTLTLTDTLPSGMELAINALNGETITFTDADGNNVLGCSYTYSDKVLTVTVPDQTYVKVTFVVKISETGSQIFSNTATLALSGTATKTASKDTYVNVLSHSATISGDKNRVIISKYDDTLTTLVNGAEFTIYLVEYDDSTHTITSESTVVGTTTTSSGQAIFSNLEYGKLYKVVETASASGYVSSGTAHYFALYDSSTEATQTKDVVTAEMTAVSTANSGLTIEVSAGPYELLVTNRSTTDIKGSISVTKVIKADGQVNENATGSFTVAIYDGEYDANSNYTPVQTKTIVVSADGTASISFSDLDLDKTYYVYELDDSRTPITDAGSYGSYTVTYENQNITVSESNSTGNVTITNDIVSTVTAEIKVQKTYNTTYPTGT